MYIDSKDAERKIRVFESNGGFCVDKAIFVPFHNAGRKAGQPNLTDEQRESLGKLANLINPKDAAEIMDVSYGTAINAKNGYVGTNGSTRHQDNELRDKIKIQDDKIEETVLEKLLLSLNVITEESMQGLDPLKAASVAEKVAGISKRNKNNNGSHAVIYAPIIGVPAKRDIKDYSMKIIEVKPDGL